jgi:hypothetical protein
VSWLFEMFNKRNLNFKNLKTAAMKFMNESRKRERENEVECVRGCTTERETGTEIQRQIERERLKRRQSESERETKRLYTNRERE